MMLKFAIFFFLICSIFAKAENSLVNNYAEKNYLVFKKHSAVTWYQAYDYCQSIGAELASLGSSEELARFIKLNNKLDGNENLEYWTSANARGNEDGIFRWLDGRVLPQSQIKNPTHTDKRGCIKLSITNKSKDISFFIDHCYHSRTQFICERSSRTNCLSTLIPYCKKRKHCVNKICPPNPCIEI